MAQESDVCAPGWPGIPARWTSSAKSGVGTAVSRDSRVWFTLSHGILNEIYYPRVDHACTRDLGFIVTDGQTYFSEEKRDARSETSQVAPRRAGVSDSQHGRRRSLSHREGGPDRSAARRRAAARSVRAAPGDARRTSASTCCWRRTWPTAAAATRPGSATTRAAPMLLAERDSFALALACSAPWLARSAGFVGVSDGWQELPADKRLRPDLRARRERQRRAHRRNRSPRVGRRVRARARLRSDRDGSRPARASSACSRISTRPRPTYVARLAGLAHDAQTAARLRQEPRRPLYHLSAAVLRTHESKRVEGGVIASLSIPWGFSKGDDDLGGYHLIWPRDLVETAGGFLAIGARHEARRVLRYLRGHAGGRRPLVAEHVARRHAVLARHPDGRNGPADSPGGSRRARGRARSPRAGRVLADGAARRRVSRAQRSGQPAGSLGGRPRLLRRSPSPPKSPRCWSPPTWPTRSGHTTAATYLRETADAWNASIERWLYVAGTELAQQHGVDGYYVRVAEPDQADAASPRHGFVPIKNRPPDQSTGPAASMVSLDALAFVRFGLRAADDPRIAQHGQGHRRDAQGRHAARAGVASLSGRRLRRTRRRRAVRRHRHRPRLAAPDRRARPLRAGGRTSATRPSNWRRRSRRSPATAVCCPEQIWDSADIPERELFLGRASGSAMPLVWAHAEYLKLCRSLRDGEVFDRPPQTVQRYLGKKAITSRHVIWRFNNKVRTMPARRTLRIETLARRSCIGASTAGGRYAIPRPTTRRWASTSWTFRRCACDGATVWSSPSIGRRWTDGRAPISSFASSDRLCPTRSPHTSVNGGRGSPRLPCDTTIPDDSPAMSHRSAVPFTPLVRSS